MLMNIIYDDNHDTITPAALFCSFLKQSTEAPIGHRNLDLCIFVLYSHSVYNVTLLLLPLSQFHQIKMLEHFDLPNFNNKLHDERDEMMCDTNQY